MEEISWAVNCPPDFAAIPLLALAGGAIGNTRRLAITKTHTQSACLFAVLVGNPGSGKSPALEQIVAPLEDAEILFREQHHRDVAEWDADDDPDRGPKPILRRALVDDVTSEKLACLLAENPRGLCMVRDELAALVTGMDQYKNGGHDRQVYLKLWSGSSIRVDRKNQSDGPVIVIRPFLSICGGVQPTVVERFRGEAQGQARPPDDGWLDRFLFSYPLEPLAIEEQWREVSPQGADILAGHAAAPAGPGVGHDGWQAAPLPARVRPERARGLDAALRAATLPSSTARTSQIFCAGHGQKFHAYCARLSLVLHHLRTACEEPVGDQVDGKSVTAPPNW